MILLINYFKNRYIKIKSFKKIEIYILWIFIIAYWIFFSYVTIQKHNLFLTGRYDLGNMDQTVWNTMHGRIFVFTNPDFNQVMSRLSVHSDFILILLAPFYLIWSDPRMLLLIQTLVIGIGALLVFLLAKEILKQKYIPLALAISYLLNPYIQEQNLFDFHAVALATTFLLAAVYFMIKKRYGFFLLFSFLAVLTKEHIFVVVGLLGAYLFFFKKKKWGLLLGLLCLTAFYLLIAKFIPAARNGTHFALPYYSDFGDSPKAIISSFFTNPSQVVNKLIQNNVFNYLKHLFLPVGFISILSPLYFIFALPEFFINMLSRDDAMRTYYYHYAAAIVPFVYITAIFGIKRFLAFFPRKKISYFVFCYIILAGVFSAWYFGPLPGSRNTYGIVLQATGEEKIVKNYLQTIPRYIPVAASNELAAHLVHRQKIYSFPNGIKKADLVLFYFPKNENKYAKNTDMGLVQKLLVNPKFQIIYQLNSFIVFQRISSMY